ncbi:MAG: tRNA lysidine(34) synthetase TilS [Acutalibacteraceae bacterium]
MTDKVLSAVSRYKMLNKGDTVLCAVSGGADSMAMLKALCELSRELEITVKAAHLNHCLRGAESDRDCRFVKEYCAKNGVSLICESIDVNNNRRAGESVETAARRIRYDFLVRAANGEGIEKNVKIATAHTLTDSAETVIMNIIRGTTLNGLCGIAPVRDNIIRPLIEVTREETENFCRMHKISFVTDSTNLTDDCRRNYIRHNLMPEFVSLNPSFYSAVLRMLRSNIAENGYMEKNAYALINAAYSSNGYNCKVLAEADETVRMRAVSEILKKFGSNAAQQRFVISVNNIILNGGNAEIPGNIIVRKRAGILEFVTEHSKEPVSSALEETVDFYEKKIKTELISAEKFKELIKVNKMLAKQAIDFDKIIANPQIRSRRGQDRVRLSGRGVTKSLKKLFSEANIMPEKRNEVAVLSDDGGILWIDGFGASERAAVGKETESVMIITVSDKEKE